MAAGIEKLTALKVARLNKPGRYADGKGLYLQITKSLAKSWIFRYERDGKERFMGLGPSHSVGLADARERARAARSRLALGKDPLDERNAEIQAAKAEKLSNADFDSCAGEYIKSRQDEWKSEKHRNQWETSLRVHVSPHIGKLAVRRITTPLIMQVLQPIWKTKTETASRIRERIERILSWAAKHGYREGENPARWDGHLEELLPKPSKLKKVVHHPAMQYREVGGFMLDLKQESGFGARALEFTILTACRTGEVLGAQWGEIDFRRRVWVIPPERMKNSKEHRVPLTDPAVEVLKKVRGFHPKLVFPGAKKDALLSNMAMLRVLENLGRTGLTVHGFRSSFRDWAAEMTQYPESIAEMCLAHTVGNAVENAYRRSDLFNRRRGLMTDWAKWCAEVQPELPAEAMDGELASEEADGWDDLEQDATARNEGGERGSSSNIADPRIDPRLQSGTGETAKHAVEHSLSSHD